MKKIISLIAAVILAAGCLTACGAAAPDSASADSRIKIVTTIFPEYDWVMNILGDSKSTADVTMLLDNGVDLHSYQPTANDIMKIASCDLFIYVGGESDKWVDDALKEATNKDMKVMNLLDILGDSVKEEELVEGMQQEEEEEEGEEEEPEYDEHVWLSLKNSATLVNSISEEIQKIDPENAEKYKANALSYIGELGALDGEYRDAVSGASVDTLLFGDRFPFRYLTDDYGLSYYAAFVGCSAETEASFETVTFLAGKVDELNLGCVMTIEGTDHRIAETIVQNTQTKDQKILSLNSMQSVTAKDVKDGADYLSIMKDNLSVLKEALGSAGPVSTGADAVSDADADVDVDLTKLSSTMVYAEVYNMMTAPQDYIGKKVKMGGMCAFYHDDTTGNDYYTCIVSDATACCSQGIEFILADGADYPADGDDICVAGVFDTYQEGEYTYCTLRNAELI